MRHYCRYWFYLMQLSPSYLVKRQTNIQTGTQINMQTNRKTGRQTNRQTNRHTTRKNNNITADIGYTCSYNFLLFILSKDKQTKEGTDKLSDGNVNPSCYHSSPIQHIMTLMSVLVNHCLLVMMEDV